MGSYVDLPFDLGKRSQRVAKRVEATGTIDTHRDDSFPACAKKRAGNRNCMEELIKDGVLRPTPGSRGVFANHRSQMINPHFSAKMTLLLYNCAHFSAAHSRRDAVFSLITRPALRTPGRALPQASTALRCSFQACSLLPSYGGGWSTIATCDGFMALALRSPL